MFDDYFEHPLVTVTMICTILGQLSNLAVNLATIFQLP